MKQSNPSINARNMVDRMMSNGDMSMAGQLSLNLNDQNKNQLLSSIRNLNYDSLSTPYGIPPSSPI